MSSCPTPAPAPRQALKLRLAHPLPRSAARAVRTHQPRRRCRRLIYGGGAGEGVRTTKWKRERRQSVDEERLNLLLSRSRKRGGHAGALKSVVLSPPMVENRLSVPFAESPPSSSISGEHDVVEEIPDRTVGMYASLIRSLIRAQQWRDVLSVFASMVAEDLKPDKFLLPKVLKACSELESLAAGAIIHGYMLKRWRELKADAFVGNSLIDMYGKCGDLLSAREMFDTMPEKDVVSWTVLLTAYTAAGLVDDAAEIFDAMRAEGVKPDVISWNALISAFAREGEKDAALRLLKAMQSDGMEPGTNSWNGLLSGFAQSGYFEDAMEIFAEMLSHCLPNAVTIASVLPACSALQSVDIGQSLHAYAIKSGFTAGNVYVLGSLIDMYMKCGEQKDAEELFMSMEKRTKTVWNEMIAGWAHLGELDKVMEFMNMMIEDELKPDVITYNTVLAAYARSGEREKAFELLSLMGKIDLKPNIVSINALVSGFQQCGLNEEALELLRETQLSSSLKLNAVSLTSALAACSEAKAQRHGKELHGFALRSGLQSNVFVSAALLDMYAKCGNMGSAVKVFIGSRERNTVTWNTMMAGYNSSGEPGNAMKLFSQMLYEGHAPSSITFLILLQACSPMAALSLGRALHGHALKTRNVLQDVNFDLIESALIDMYAKCGSIQEARMVFNSADQNDLASWNAMIHGYSLHAMASESLSLFREMEKYGISPDDVTFTSILSACRQDGFMDVGWRYFNMMDEIYGVKHRLEHFTCMVGIMGNAGLLEEALDFIQRMPVKPDACTWAALLHACKAHSDYHIGRTAADALFELEPKNPSNYIIISNIYAAVGMWESAMQIRHLMRARRLNLAGACSWIYVRHRAHVFESGGRRHHEMDRVLEKWDRLALKMENLGYFPQDPCLDEEEADPFTCFHTEKLALCYGLISLTSSLPVRVSKNARMCIDCHTSAKFISKMEDREVVVRDSCCFHSFVGGVCSCGDRW